MRAPITVILASSILSAGAPAQTASLTVKLDSSLRALEAKGFSGIVRVDTGGLTVLEKGYGLANRAERIPFTPSTVVQIGSNTKDFTMVSLLQLQARGRLDLRDSLAKYFPNAPSDKRGITLAQLTDHRAGFPIGLGGDFDALSREQFLDAAFKRPLNFPPGTGRQYSNTGYSILAAVIEQVSGKPYDEYVRENILSPLGLTNTGFLLPKFDAKRLAHGYRNGEDQGTIIAKPHANDGPYWNLRGNGGMLSTVGDMHAFYKALIETDKLLKPESKGRRFDPNQPIGLAGSDLVFVFVYERLPAQHLELIIATNNSELRDREVRAAIAPILGLPSVDGPPNVAGTPKVMRAPSAPVAALLNEFVATINAADSTALVKFIRERFIIEPGAPGAEPRAGRLIGLHKNLGVFQLKGLNELEPGIVEVSVNTAAEGPATLRVQVDASGAPKIKGFQVLVGG